MKLIAQVRNYIIAALNADSDPVNRARIHILFYTIAVSTVFTGGLTIVYAINGPLLQLVRIIIVFTALTTGLYKIVVSGNYRPAAHIIILLFNMLVWSNIFVVIQAVNIVTVQYILLAITCSFYLLSARTGMIYSIIVLLPVALYFMLNGTDNVQVLVTPQQASDPVFVAVMLFNFFMMIFINYHFLRAFYYTINKLRMAQIEEKLLNERLKAAVDMAEASSRAKSDFLSTMSHELRTPLNSVIGMSHVLLADNPREDQEENLKVLHFSAASLLSLINDILDFNKLEYGKIQLERTPFNATDLITGMYSGLKRQAEEKGLTFDLYLDKHLEKTDLVGDPTRLLQILFNLVGNAIKFTSSGTVSLRVDVTGEEDEHFWLKFSVRDTGIGISKQQQEVIFEPFSQASTNITREFGGTGLGLAITKQLLSLHESEIAIDSALGKGTSFFFTIKYARAALVESSEDRITISSAPNSAVLSDLKILVAEDNAMNVLLMKKLFSNWEITADFACNGKEAVEMAGEHKYDLILMDIHMPIMDGYEASRKIRSLYGDQQFSTRIIALTASVASDVHRKVLDAGMDDYISKPFNPPDLKYRLIQMSGAEISSRIK